MKKKIYLSILLICVFVGMFSVVLIAFADDYGGNPNLVPVEKEYGYKYSKDWTFSNYINNVDFPSIAYNTLIENSSNTQLATNYKVWGVKKNDYICVGYVYVYGGYEYLALLIYDKETKTYISAVNTYHQFCVEDIEYNNGNPAEHRETEGGILRYYYSTGIIKTNVPVFNSKKACDKYASTGSIEGALAVPDELKCESPQKLDVYCSNDNIYDLTLVWQQYEDTTDMYSVVEVGYTYNFDLDYHMPPNYFDNGLPEVFKKNSQIIDNNYSTSATNKVKFDVSNIVKRYALANDTDNICFVFVVQNNSVDNTKSSSYAFVRVFVDKNGVNVYSSGSEDNSYNKQPIKNETDYSKDNGYSYTKDDFTTINSTTNEGFINSIISGFGLIGNNGLLPLLGGVFAYIPDWLWALIGTGVTFMVIIALFKLVVH